MQLAVQINNTHVKTKKIPPPFKGMGFYSGTAELEKNIVLSRAIIDMAGCDIPWIIMANNNQERKERARRYAIVFGLAFLSPIVLLPVINRFTMKNIAKLTTNFWSNNHKAIHLSNEFLTNSYKTEIGLNELAQKTTMGPIEIAYSKIFKKKNKQTLNLNELIKNVDGDYEKLRLKLIKAKNITFGIDFLLSGLSLGSLGFLNNYLTKKKTGQAGFSAEFKMADKSIVENRADNYEKNKNKRYAMFVGTTIALSILMPLLTKKGLSTTNLNSKFGNFIKKNANNINYKDGIYMERFAFLMLLLVNHGGLLMASRNKTEAKDNAIRMGSADAIFIGGDLLLRSIFANLSDNLLKTKLIKQENSKSSFFRKIFPKVKSLKEIIKLVENKSITNKNKQIAAGIFWLNMTLLSIAMGLGVPTLINKIIKKDVSKDVEKHSKTNKKTFTTENLKKNVFEQFQTARKLPEGQK